MVISSNLHQLAPEIYLNLILSKQIPTKVAIQPIYDLKSNVVYGYEVLARWQNIRPDIIFEVAHKMQAVDELEHLILAEIPSLSEQIKEKLFINIYPTMPNPYAWGFLKAYDVILEITEAAEISYVGIETLKEFGFTLALDDIGTGFAAFEVLTRLQPDYLKIDKSLTQSINIKARNSLIKAFIDHAERVDAKVIIEGIETKEQLFAVKSLGAHYGQGYLLGIPKIVRG